MSLIYTIVYLTDISILSSKTHRIVMNISEYFQKAIHTWIFLLSNIVTKDRRKDIENIYKIVSKKYHLILVLNSYQ